MRYLLSLLLTTSALVAAPVPTPKPLPPHQIEGAWNMDWRDGTSSVWLGPNGFFADYYRGENWLGTWKLEGDVLTVTERAPNGNEITWSATLARPQRDRTGAVGTLTYGGQFRLRE